MFVYRSIKCLYIEKLDRDNAFANNLKFTFPIKAFQGCRFEYL